jgi:site-specific recombinase XerC
MKQKWDISYIKEPKLNKSTERWIVYGVLPHRTENGKRKVVRKSFKSRPLADAFVAEQRAKGLKYLASGDTRRTRLSVHEESDAINAIKLLEANFEGDPRTLTDAVAFYVDQYANLESNVTLNDAVGRYLKWDKFTANSDHHQNQFKRRLNKFKTAFDSKMVSSFKKATIQNWLDGKRATGVSETEIRNEYSCLHAFFNFCVKEEFCRGNPVSKVHKPSVKKGKVQILSNDEVKTLMQFAEGVDGGSMLPYFALGIFCAIRPEEIQRLDWADINLKKDRILIDGKGQRERPVAIHPTAKAWLEPVALEEGPVAPDNCRKLFNLVRALAGFRIAKLQLNSLDLEGYEEELEDCDSKERPMWINDVMRHTGITFYVQHLDDNVNKVARWAGNSVAVIHSHYLAVRGVDDDVTEEFYGILPES